MSDFLERAIRLREAGELEEARAVLLKLLEKNPEDPAVNYQCAWVHDRMGREREAIPLYERAIEMGLSGGDPEGAILSLGSSYRAVGNPAEACGTGGGASTANLAIQCANHGGTEDVGESAGTIRGCRPRRYINAT